MSDNDEGEDPATRTGELIRGGAPLPLAAPTGQERTLYRLFRRLSTFSFFNKRYVESLKSAKEVVDAKSELGEAIGRDQEIRERLKDLGTTLERGREERRRQLFEEKLRRLDAENSFKLEEKMTDQKNKLKTGELNIQKMEQEMRKLRVKKELEELKNPPAPPPQPEEEPTGRGTSKKQKLRERAYAKRDSEIKRIDRKRMSPETKEALKRTAENELEEELRRIDEMP